MATLMLKGTFSFYKQAKNVTKTMNDWLTDLRAIDIIINIIKLKFSKNEAIEAAAEADFEGAGINKNFIYNDVMNLLLTGGGNNTPSEAPFITNKIYFLRGRTGSGKSTFMIQELYKALIMNTNATLFCTEPRVVLTKSNPLDVIRYNPEWKLGGNIGIMNGTEKIMPKDRSNIIYGTTQILNDILTIIIHTQNENAQRRLLKKYKIIIIDECHVLDSPMMSILKTVWDILNKFGNWLECPLFIFSSATIDIIKMIRYYAKAINCQVNSLLSNPLIIGEVAGSSNYKINEIFMTETDMKKVQKLEMKSEHNAGFVIFAGWFWNKYGDSLYKSDSYLKVDGKNVQCRDVLLFVPLFSAIDIIGDYFEQVIKGTPFMKVLKGCKFDAVQAWRDKNRNKKRILYVGFGRNYSQASDEILSRSLEPDEEARKYETKIICSTSVIETGKTISTLHICLNMGLDTMSIYNPLAYKFETLVNNIKQVPCNKNQVIQRLGRVGREAPGIFIHFYTKEIYEKFRTQDISETINNAYLSGLVLNDLISNNNVNSYIDLLTMNNYYYPISTDILINTARDLIESGFMTGLGQFVELKDSLQLSENWIVYAKYLFYILGWSLWESLLFASINRKALPFKLNIYGISPKGLRYKLDEYKNDNEEVFESIKRARNALTKILYGTDKTFKCSKYRIYNRLTVEPKLNN